LTPERNSFRTTTFTSNISAPSNCYQRLLLRE